MYPTFESGMTAEDLRRIKNAHIEALKLPAVDRNAFIESVFADEPELRAELRQLLDSNDLAGDFLNTPFSEPAPLRPPSVVGQQVGNYKLLRELGIGGTASVYLATRL